MRTETQGKLATLIARATDSDFSPICNVTTCSGGCIHTAQIVHLEDGRRYFVKSSPDAGNMLAQEATGLAALRMANCLRAPEVIAAGMLDGRQACLVLEAIEVGALRKDFWQQFGRAFASLHQTATAAAFGWSSDNYLGSSIQRNAATDDWILFFAECRLGYQARLARNNALGSREFFKLLERLIGRLERVLGGCSDPPSLLHGDLWSGNYVVDTTGNPVIVDPAVYYGQREADLAMPLLFGGFESDFFDAYHEAWPLQDGWRERAEVYKLYHLINHLNMFGSGYLDSCLEIVRRFA